MARHERVFCRYGLRRANLVIAQTVTQQKLLRENFGIDSTVIPSCAPDYRRCRGGADAVASNLGRRLLWIGAFTPIKRLELLLDIAEQNQDLQFDVIGDCNSELEYVQCLRSRAKSMPNVHLHGTVAHAHVQQFYQRTAALICTSRAEGFPNIFVEAWSHSLPIVSTFDPDNLIVKNELGIVAQDVKGLASGTRTLLGDSQRWQRVSEAARQYYLGNHTVDAVMTQFEKVFLYTTRELPSRGPS